MTQPINNAQSIGPNDFIDAMLLAKQVKEENKHKAKLGEKPHDKDCTCDSCKNKHELRKKCKSHHKMLTEKADKHYEDGNKELGKKYRGLANKLADDMEDENNELSLANYEIDEAALSNPQLSEMQQVKADLEAKFVELQKSLTETITTSLGITKPATAKLSRSEKIISEWETALNKAKELLKGDE